MEKIKKAMTIMFWGIVSVLGGYYLMKLVNEITMSNSFEKVFMIVYFTAMLLLFDYFYGKCIMKKWDNNTKHILVSCIILSIMSAILLNNRILPRFYQDVTLEITLLNNKNNDSQGYEGWITSVTVNGSIQELRNYVKEEEWEYRENEKALYANANDCEKKITIKASEVSDIKVKFVKHAWSGSVTINANGLDETFDLYDPNGSDLLYSYSGTSVQYVKSVKYILYIGYCVIMSKLIFIFLMFIPKNKIRQVDRIYVDK